MSLVGCNTFGSWFVSNAITVVVLLCMYKSLGITLILMAMYVVVRYLFLNMLSNLSSVVLNHAYDILIKGTNKERHWKLS